MPIRNSGCRQRRREPAKPPQPRPRRWSTSTTSMPPHFELTQIPVNPTDPIAIVNGQVITRQQLADECVAREGQENPRAPDQPHADRAGAPGQEARSHGGRDRPGDRHRRQAVRNRPRRLAAHPRQGARNQPGAVRPRHHLPGARAAETVHGRVQVTPKDMKEAFEAQYGEKIRCRMILVDTQAKAVAIWEELRKNPGGFEKIAKEQSMDTGSRSLGGLLGEPITRHAYPQNALRRGLPAARRRRPEGQRPEPQAEGRRLHRARSRSARWSGSSCAANRSIPRQPGRRPEGRAGSQARPTR